MSRIRSIIYNLENELGDLENEMENINLENEKLKEKIEDLKDILIVKSLNDEFKLNLIKDIWYKYSLEELEQIFEFKPGFGIQLKLK